MANSKWAFLTLIVTGFGTGCGGSATTSPGLDDADAQDARGDGLVLVTDSSTAKTDAADAGADAKADAATDSIAETKVDTGAITADTKADSVASEVAADTGIADTGVVDTGVADTAPVDAGPPPIKIKHIVVIVKENHTYDNMYGSFVPAPYVDSSGVSHPQTANGLTACPVNPAAAGIPATTGACLEAPDKIGHDLNHAHDSALADWNLGAMNGWSTANGSDHTGGGAGDGTVYKQYFQQDIPNYWKLAKNFVLADNNFANELGPSFPGHFFTVAAQAGWATDNPPTDLFGPTAPGLCKLITGASESPYWGCDEYQGGTISTAEEILTLGACSSGAIAGDTVPILQSGSKAIDTFPCFNIPAVPDILPAGVTWKMYGTDWSELTMNSLTGVLSSVLGDITSLVLVQEPWGMLDAVQGIRDTGRWASNTAIIGTPWDTSNQLATDLTNGTLANVSWVIDQDEYSEHPDLNLNDFVSGLNFPLGGVCDGENWTIGYVKMIMASQYWKDTAILITYDDFGGWYDHVKPARLYDGPDQNHPYGLGFRLPLLIVSPWVKHGFMLHDQTEQASIASFVEAVFPNSTNANGPTLADQPGGAAAQDKIANNLLNAFDFGQTPPAAPTMNYRCCPSESNNPPGCLANP